MVPDTLLGYDSIQTLSTRFSPPLQKLKSIVFFNESGMMLCCMQNSTSTLLTCWFGEISSKLSKILIMEAIFWVWLICSLFPSQMVMLKDAFSAETNQTEQTFLSGEDQLNHLFCTRVERPPFENWNGQKSSTALEIRIVALDIIF